MSAEEYKIHSSLFNDNEACFTLGEDLEAMKAKIETIAEEARKEGKRGIYQLVKTFEGVDIHWLSGTDIEEPALLARIKPAYPEYNRENKVRVLQEMLGAV